MVKSTDIGQSTDLKVQSVVGETRVLRIYRSALPIVGGGVGALALLLVGLSGLLPANHAGIGGLVISVLSLGSSVLLMAILVTNRLVVTDDGIVWCQNLRRRSLSWSDVWSVEVGRSRSLFPWPGLVINSRAGSARIDSVVGMSSFVERVVAELVSFRQEWRRVQAGDG